MAVSHKVIQNFLEETLRAAVEAGMILGTVHKVSKRSEQALEGLDEETDNARARQGLDTGKVLGGTAWLWARDDMLEAVDYLFVDEAGQMSLAHALAAGRSAKNLVLIGDPQQLSSPSEERIRKAPRSPPWSISSRARKLSPKIVASSSTSRGACIRKSARSRPRSTTRAGCTPDQASNDKPLVATRYSWGVVSTLYPCGTRETESRSREEVEVVARVADDLLGGGVQWTDDDGTTRPLRARDMLVVTPYNAQVGALAARLPGNQHRHLSTSSRVSRRRWSSTRWRAPRRRSAAGNELPLQSQSPERRH